MRKMFIIRPLKKIPQTKEQTNRAHGAYSPAHNFPRRVNERHRISDATHVTFEQSFNARSLPPSSSSSRFRFLFFLPECKIQPSTRVINEARARARTLRDEKRRGSAAALNTARTPAGSTIAGVWGGG